MATKRTSTRTNSSRHLPIEVVSEILSRLPSKSLLRFRCVCKSWRDLITDPNFIEFHRHQNNNSHILIQHDTRTFSLHCEKTFEPHTRLEPMRLREIFATTDTGEFLPRKFSVLGYTNGLVCLILTHLETFDRDSKIYTWNPSIRKLKLLPDSPSQTRKTRYYQLAFSFAFVARINDYRLLKITSCIDNDVIVKSEIYSLRTNSWKMVEHEEVRCEVHANHSARAVNGVVYFMATEVDSNNNIILSFNMVNEVFRKIMIPEAAFNQDSLDERDMHPMMFGELLLVIGLSYVPLTSSDRIDIWVMNEYGVVEDSTKKLSFDYWILPLGFLKNGELVFQYEEPPPYGLSSYDPILSEIKDLQFIGASEYLHAVTHYMESLVLLNKEPSIERRWNLLIQLLHVFG